MDVEDDNILETVQEVALAENLEQFKIEENILKALEKPIDFENGLNIAKLKEENQIVKKTFIKCMYEMCMGLKLDNYNELMAHILQFHFVHTSIKYVNVNEIGSGGTEEQEFFCLLCQDIVGKQIHMIIYHIYSARHLEKFRFYKTNKINNNGQEKAHTEKLEHAKNMEEKNLKPFEIQMDFSDIAEVKEKNQIVINTFIKCKKKKCQGLKLDNYNELRAHVLQFHSEDRLFKNINEIRWGKVKKGYKCLICQDNVSKQRKKIIKHIKSAHHLKNFQLYKNKIENGTKEVECKAK